jgi:uncharacterized protein YjbI with pentapeptide repeats
MQGFVISGINAGTVTRTEEYQPEKALWDWLQLLIAPAAISFFGLWFTRVQQQRDQRLADQQHDRDEQLAQQRDEANRYLAIQTQQEVALQSYFDRISELLLKEDLRSSESAEVRHLARARTITVLRGLEAARKGSVLLFLIESDLIHLISLNQADLQGVSLSNADLQGVDWHSANLSMVVLRCNMKGIDLTRANLSRALLSGNLTGAKLSDANLSNATLIFANLAEADLSRANLSGAKVASEQLEKQAASLEGATMPDGSKHP